MPFVNAWGKRLSVDLRSKKVVTISVWLTAIVSMLHLGCAKEKREGSAELVWLDSFDEAVRIADQKNKMIMIDFYADWCGWCKRLDETTYKDADVIAKGKNLINVRIDADREHELVKRYKISGLPTILFIDSTGKEIHRVVGYRQPQDFVKEMAFAESNFKNR